MLPLKVFRALVFQVLIFRDLAFRVVVLRSCLPFTRTSRPTRFLLACSRRSDNGVRRDGREREKSKEEKKEGVPSLSPLPLVVFFSAQISDCPHDLHVWNRLGSCA